MFTYIFTFLVLLTLIVFTLGLYFSKIYFVGDYATILGTFFTLHAIVGIIFFIAVLLFLQSEQTLLTFVTISIGSIVLLAWTYPLYSIYSYSDNNNISFNIKEHVFVTKNEGDIAREKSIKYYSQDEKKLYLDHHKTSIVPENKLRKPIVMVHGGGFTSGHRSDEPEWIEFFNSLGYDVFSVEYSLANNDFHTWNIAGREVQTALGWLSENASELNININELVVMGSSAGGTIAMQAVYGADTNYISYDTYPPVVPKKLITLYPAVNLAKLWEADTTFYGIRSRDTQFLGGTPSEYPERYSYASVENLVSENSPDTLIIHGANDTLIPKKLFEDLFKRYEENDVSYSFYALPFMQHGFAYFSSGFGFGMSRDIIQKYLK